MRRSFPALALRFVRGEQRLNLIIFMLYVLFLNSSMKTRVILNFTFGVVHTEEPGAKRGGWGLLST